MKLIFEQFEITESCTEVANILNQQGFRTKKLTRANQSCGERIFTAKDVRRILKDPYYKGCVTHKGAMYKGEHEAIIKEEIWNKVQEIFQKPRGGNGRKKYNSGTSSFLKGILKCEKCGTAMTPTYAYNHGLRYRYYTCSNHIRHKSCVSQFKTVPADDIEQKVLDEIFKILRSPEVMLEINKLIENEKDKDFIKANMISAVNNLAEVWNFLYPAEQYKIAKILIEIVTISDEGIRIKMDLDGFDCALRQLSSN